VIQVLVIQVLVIQVLEVQVPGAQVPGAQVRGARAPESEPDSINSLIDRISAEETSVVFDFQPRLTDDGREWRESFAPKEGSVRFGAESSFALRRGTTETQGETSGIKGIQRARTIRTGDKASPRSQVDGPTRSPRPGQLQKTTRETDLSRFSPRGNIADPDGDPASSPRDSKWKNRRSRVIRKVDMPRLNVALTRDDEKTVSTPQNSPSTPPNSPSGPHVVRNTPHPGLGDSKAQSNWRSLSQLFGHSAIDKGKATTDGVKRQSNVRSDRGGAKPCGWSEDDIRRYVKRQSEGAATSDGD
jgi:hypothetical protein